MKKILSVIALAGIMASCNNTKEDKTETTKDTASTTTTTDPAPTNTTTTAADGVPNFSDPEVQKFANDYAAFIKEYKAGMSDPARMQELSKQMQDWSTKSQNIGAKLASNPDDLKKWTDWVQEISKSMMPGGK